MKLSVVRDLLNAKVLTDEGEERLSEIDIQTACGSDLMSDVLAFVKDQGLLITGLINPQVVRTAEMMDIYAICFVRGKIPDDSIVALARGLGMPLLQTDLSLFVSCGMLYKGGLMCERE